MNDSPQVMLPFTQNVTIQRNSSIPSNREGKSQEFTLRKDLQQPRFFFSSVQPDKPSTGRAEKARDQRPEEDC